jgi:hypothetical protein
MQTPRFVALSLLCGALACDADDRETLEAEAEAAAADEVEAALAEPSTSEIPLAGASADRPCGEHTTAVVEHESGSTLTFCVLDEAGVVAIGESRPIGTASLLSEIGYNDSSMCPADVLRWAAPDREVPAELEAACDPTQQRLRTTLAEDGTVETHDVDAPQDLQSVLHPDALASNYCGSNGATLFNSERCSFTKSWWQADPLANSMWCINTFWGWHDRSLYGTRGDEGNLGNDTVAVCSGTVRFRAWWRWDVGDSWIGSLDGIYGHGTLNVWQIEYHGGWEDIDIRFRVESNDGVGVHRHTGRFKDD